MKKIINEIIELFGIMVIVVFVWQLLEVIIEGNVNPNNVDTIIGMILTYSLYYNYKTWKNK